ncbi:LysR substrate-binding domain-containing protein [Klebsiella variicola]|nr:MULTISPECIES: LysR substrate-binding domain-containing protein [Klebsiella]ELN9656171.1 LysR family transcriptional regulator [Klebsiella variicola]MBZ9583833.1 LysR family transcriptional regulator [Klebsiella quasivariicola]MCP3438187.1 LysR substrate-binding domain-containing protein [Klebsiella variicola]UVW47212.1 LysR substrate-binding domain-containing protein [Klebsiella variicola]SXF32710.1 positive regulator of Tartrate dehydrogenase/decarboxylase/D-malic enzyme [Klebsiella variic
MRAIKTGKEWPLIEDLHVFLTIIYAKSFSKAAQDMGVSPAYISKRIKILEKNLGITLFHRDPRHLTLTEEGENIASEATKVLDNMDCLLSTAKLPKKEISGDINICTSFGFGINHVSRAVSALSKLYPQLNIRLHLTDQEVDLANKGFHLEIKVGDIIKEQNRARKLADNYRILCASPEYLQQNGTPEKLEDLEHHNCLFIQEKNSSFGLWNLEREGINYPVRIKSHLATNCGSVAMQWSLAAHGIMLRSWWDVYPHIKTGSLINVLPEYRQSANIWAVYPGRISESEKLYKCIEFLAHYFSKLVDHE